MKLRILFVAVFTLLLAPFFFGSSRSHVQSPNPFVAVAQCGGHADGGSGCSPTVSPSTHSARVAPGERRHRTEGSEGTGDLGGIASGLMAAAVGLLFWLRVR